MLETLHQLLISQNRILLLTHENPDADAIGSLVGLCRYLRLQGKDVQARIAPMFPAFLRFMDPEHCLEIFDPQRDSGLGAWAELILVADASEMSRLGVMLELVQASKALKVCLDHHMKTSAAGFDQDFTDSAASATCERVFDFLEGRLPHPWPADVSMALYAGLADDTGYFRFPNMSPKAHRVAAVLMEEGADPAAIYQSLYHQGRPERLKIFSRAFSGLRMMAEGRYGALQLTLADMADCSAIHDDIEGLVNKPLELRGVEVSCLLNELEDGRIKASLRSRGRVDVNAICRKMGGGGHRLASGVKIAGPMEVAQARIDAAIIEQISLDITETRNGYVP